MTTATVRVALATSAAAPFAQGSSVACPYVAKAKQYQCSLKLAKKGTFFLQTWQQVGTTGGGNAWVLAANASAVVGTATANGGAVVVR